VPVPGAQGPRLRLFLATGKGYWNRHLALPTFLPPLAESSSMRVLGIETSCDETGVAVYDTDAGLRAHALYGQIALHAEYGGVVPELASRDHVRKLLPLIRQTLAEAGLGLDALDGVA